ncbi:hypothetical protein ATER59S_00962 [Aquamicrobium terrae]
MATPKSPKRASTRQIAVAKGFRSGLEDKVAGELDAASVTYNYEQFKITYELPARLARFL